MSNLIVFIDSGDTLIDEGTEVRDARAVVLRAQMIPGAKEALLAMRQKGYTVALVADGFDESFNNVYRQHHLMQCFDAWVPSSTLGVEKPDARMFREAMAQLGLTDADIPRIVMIGNNLTRDIRGANALGITSILMRWSSRYSYTPTADTDVPTYAVSTYDELLSLLERLSERLDA